MSDSNPFILLLLIAWFGSVWYRLGRYYGRKALAEEIQREIDAELRTTD